MKKKISLMFVLAAMFLFSAMNAYAVTGYYNVTISSADSSNGSWSGGNPDTWTPNGTGSNVSVADIQTKLSSMSVIINTAEAGGTEDGDITISNDISWSSNSLILNANRDININAIMTASDTSTLAMTTTTGAVKVGFASGVANGFAGRVDFPGRSGSGFLTINSQTYIVINSLGAEGSTTGLDLQGIKGNLSGKYALGADIDASATSAWNSKAGFDPINYFTGIFDGLGHTIKNLNIHRTDTSYVGLFGYATNSKLRNMGLVKANITDTVYVTYLYSYVGGLAGYYNSGTVSNCYATGKVKGLSYYEFSYVGGLLGYNSGPISNSYSTNDVEGGSDIGGVGGLVGKNSGPINNSYNTGEIEGSSYDAGGLVGSNSGPINNSYNTGTVTSHSYRSSAGGVAGYNSGTITKSYNTGRVYGKYYVGGVVGFNSGAITRSYNTGIVYGFDSSLYVGGLAGWNWDTISNSYSTGSVSGNDYVGGLVGYNTYYGTISNSYSTGSVSGNDYVGGLVGDNKENATSSYSFWDTETSGQSTSAGGTGKTTAEMMDFNTFNGAGWDISTDDNSTIWLMYDDLSYPLLQSLPVAQLVVNKTGTASGTVTTSDCILKWTDNTGVCRVNYSSIIFTATADTGSTFTGWSGDCSGFDTTTQVIANVDKTCTATFDRFYDVTISSASSSNGSWSGGTPDVWTPNGTGSNVSVTDIQTRLSSGSIIINTAAIGGTEDGGITVSSDISWSGNSLTLNANLDININAIMTASGTSTLAMTTLNGTVKVGLASGEANGFAGRVDFPERSGNGFLTINSQAYTVINSLGSEGSTTGLDLQGMKGNFSGNYALGADIDASATSVWNSNAGFEPLGNNSTKFTGVFEGFGHTVNNLTINRPSTNYVGLFGYSSNTNLRNVGLVNANITGNNNVGGLAGANSGTISNNYSTGNITGSSNYVGGLVGYNSAAISNSYSTGSVTGGNNVGGLIGYSSYRNSTISSSYSTGSITGSGSKVGGLTGANSGTISNSYSTGSVFGSSESYYVGGLVGYNYDYGTISNSYSTGSVTGGNYVGGLVGYNYSYRYKTIISNSYSKGSISGNDYVGGLVGYNNGTISNSYGTGSVIGNAYIGGLVGSNASSTISNSYSKVSVTGNDYVGGLVGSNASSTINNSYSTGGVIGINKVGGLAGDNNSGIIKNSYSTVIVIGRGDYVGGLVGGNSDGTIGNSYSTGSVTGGYFVGGLVGYNNSTISNSFSTGSVSGNYKVGGLVGYSDYNGIASSSFWDKETSGKSSSAGGTEKTTAEMMYFNTFSNAGWNITSGYDPANIWGIYEGNTYPFLQSLVFQLTVNKTGTGSGTVSASGCTLTWTDNSGACRINNSSIMLTAVPDYGSAFNGWSGDCSGIGITTQFAVDEDKTCTAIFKAIITQADPFGDYTFTERWDVSSSGEVTLIENSKVLHVTINNPQEGCSYSDLTSKEDISLMNLLVETGVNLMGNGEMLLRLKKDDSNFVQFGIKQFGPDGIPDFIIGSSNDGTYTEQALDLSFEYLVKKKYKYKTFSIVKTGEEYRAYLNNMDTGAEVTNPLLGDEALKVELLNGVCSDELKGTNNYFDYVFISETIDGSIPAEDLTLLYPNGGETIKTGSMNLALWEGPEGASSYSIDYSVDGGIKWKLLDSGIEGKFYTWKLSKEKPRTAYKLRVRALDASGNIIDWDASDSNFSVSY